MSAVRALARWWSMTVLAAWVWLFGAPPDEPDPYAVAMAYLAPDDPALPEGDL